MNGGDSSLGGDDMLNKLDSLAAVVFDKSMVLLRLVLVALFSLWASLGCRMVFKSLCSFSPPSSFIMNSSKYMVKP